MTQYQIFLLPLIAFAIVIFFPLFGKDAQMPNSWRRVRRRRIALGRLLVITLVLAAFITDIWPIEGLNSLLQGFMLVALVMLPALAASMIYAKRYGNANRVSRETDDDSFEARAFGREKPVSARAIGSTKRRQRVVERAETDAPTPPVKTAPLDSEAPKPPSLASYEVAPKRPEEYVAAVTASVPQSEEDQYHEAPEDEDGFQESQADVRERMLASRAAALQSKNEAQARERRRLRRAEAAVSRTSTVSGVGTGEDKKPANKTQAEIKQANKEQYERLANDKPANERPANERQIDNESDFELALVPLEDERLSSASDNTVESTLDTQETVRIPVGEGHPALSDSEMQGLMASDEDQKTVRMPARASFVPGAEAPKDKKPPHSEELNADEANTAPETESSFNSEPSSLDDSSVDALSVEVEEPSDHLEKTSAQAAYDVLDKTSAEALSDEFDKTSVEALSDEFDKTAIEALSDEFDKTSAEALSDDVNVEESSGKEKLSLADSTFDDSQQHADLTGINGFDSHFEYEDTDKQHNAVQKMRTASDEAEFDMTVATDSAEDETRGDVQEHMQRVSNLVQSHDLHDSEFTSPDFKEESVESAKPINGHESETRTSSVMLAASAHPSEIARLSNQEIVKLVSSLRKDRSRLQKLVIAQHASIEFERQSHDKTRTLTRDSIKIMRSARDSQKQAEKVARRERTERQRIEQKYRKVAAALRNAMSILEKRKAEEAASAASSKVSSNQAALDKILS